MAKKMQAQQVQEKPISGGYITPKIPRILGRTIVVAVQNNTEMHKDFWELLKQYASDTASKIVACPILYNKSAWAQPDDVEEKSTWFATPKSMMLESRTEINGVLVVADAHVLPTAKNPLSGFQALGEGFDTVVIPASKIALECLPALKGAKGKTLISTGTATLKNYIQRKVGQTSETEHNFGFVVIEPDGRVRQVEYIAGAFFDFDGEKPYQYGEAHFGSPVLVLGDIHAEKCNVDRLWAMNALIKKTGASEVVIHDLLDFTSRNHHNRKNHFFRYQHDQQGDSIQGDVEKASKALDTLGSGANCEFLIVESNHDRALDRWLCEADYREDTVNAETYLILALAKLKAIKNSWYFNAFEVAIGEFGGDLENTVFFNPTDASIVRYGVELGNHGDKGPNGSRGSIQGFRKLGMPLVIGHSHTPGIAGKVYQVGVGGDLDMGYNEGPSSWRHAHCLVFPNGQRQIIFE